MIFFDSLNHSLTRSVADACASRGEEIVDVSVFGGVQAALELNGTPRGLVFGPAMRCEAQMLGEAGSAPDAAKAMGSAIQNDTIAFLADCRQAVQAMMTAKDGQILFLGIDDVAARLVGVPQTPIANQSRISALKSLAKEYGRMGIRFNAVISQPAKESVEPGIWRERRDALKVYTMRFTPTANGEYAEFCAEALTGAMPVNGGTLCLGKGVMEMVA